MPLTLLPSDRGTRKLRVKLSEVLVMKCKHCGYQGAVKIVTGYTAEPLFLCPECKRIATEIKGKALIYLTHKDER